MQIQNLRRKRRVKAVVKNVVASFRGQFVCFSATIRSRSRTTSCVLEEDHSPLIREGAARLLPVGLQGGRYYPCGFFAMSFFSRKLIDGAENCGGERLTYRLDDSVILLTWMECRLQTARSLFFPRFFLSFFFWFRFSSWKKIVFSIPFGWILLPCDNFVRLLAWWMIRKYLGNTKKRRDW